MPQVNIVISKKLGEEAKKELQLAIGGAMPLIPGKNIDNTHICVIDGCSIYKSGKPAEGAFVDVRLMKASPEEAKKEFSVKLFGILKEKLNIEPRLVYMNFIELEHWASNGSYS